MKTRKARVEMEIEMENADEVAPSLLRGPPTPPCARRGDVCNCEYCPSQCGCDCHLCRRKHEASDDTLFRTFVCLTCCRASKNALPAEWHEKRLRLEQAAEQLVNGDQAAVRHAQQALRTFTQPRFATDHEVSTPSQFLNETVPKGCPGCAAPMRMVGPSFMTPKKTDKKGWARVKKLLDAGYLFTGCPCAHERNAAALVRLGVEGAADVR